jgi:predicted dehydrogenase
MPLNYEYPKRLQVGYIGGGEHSYRHILPCLRYAPIELAALADHNTVRGLEVARQFGARRFYPNHKALLAKEKLDAVLIVVGPDQAGHPRYPEIAADALNAGLHTWVDAPPCSSAAEIKTYTDACLRGHKYIVTGFRRMFVPAYVKLSQIIAQPEFGGVSSFAMRYAATPPPGGQTDHGQSELLLDLLQPYSVLSRLFGEALGFSLLRSKAHDMVISLRFREAVGTLHITGAEGPCSPGERLEVVGHSASAVVENGTRLVYYRPDVEGGVGRLAEPIDSASLLWEPDVARDGMLDAAPFLSGYVGCLRHFAEALLKDEPPRYGNLVDMLHVMTVHDKLVSAKDEVWVTI